MNERKDTEEALPVLVAKAPALKEIFDANCFHHVADELGKIFPRFEAARFLELALINLNELALLARLRRLTECLHATLPADYREALAILRKLAPRIERSFVTLSLSDFVGRYGLEQFELSMEALKFLTTFGSSEFAIREFLRLDLPRTLAVLESWSLDENEHVRRLASEGCRPRLPWSFRLSELIADPAPVLPILQNLRADPSLYVRKSVANHLNDITKDHPTWVLDLLESWPRENAHPAWIARHALRTLIKKGDQRALAIIGAADAPKVLVHDLQILPQQISLGQKIVFSFRLASRAAKPQRLVVDYVIHYRKKSGSSSAKVFKLKELTLAPRQSITLTRAQTIRDFTTRVHHPGRHDLEILINGQRLAKDFFDLLR